MNPPKRESVVSTMTFPHTNVKYAKMFKFDPLLHIAYMLRGDMEQYIGVFLSALDSTSLRWFNLEVIGTFLHKDLCRIDLLSL